jgi:hypothetical protein
MCSLLLTPLMGVTSSPPPLTTPSESGIPKLVLQLAIPYKGILTMCCLPLALLMGPILFLDPMTELFESGMPRLVLHSAHL